MGIRKSHVSLGRIIDSACYKGDDLYPAIVSHDLWNKAQAERNRRADGLGRNKNYFAEDKTTISPFWNKIYCIQCDQPYRRYSEKGKQRWRCSQRTVSGKICCNSPVILEHEFEEAFMKMYEHLDLTDIAVRAPRKSIAIEQKYDDPFKQAEYAYSLTQIDGFEFKTSKLFDILKTAPTEFEGEFIKQIIKRIEVTHCDGINFILINEKVCKGEVAHGNGAINEKNSNTSKA